MSSRTVSLSKTDFDTIKRACRNRFSWTDGGQWNGRGGAPDCSASRAKSQIGSIRVRWPTEESAARWSRDIAATHRAVGYGVGLLVSLAAAMLPPTRVIPSNLRDFALSVALGEAGARFAPPGVEKGESMKLALVMNYSEPASPWLRRTFTVKVTTEWFDSRGTRRGEPAVSEQRYSADEFPFDLAWQLVNRPPIDIDMAY